VFVGVLVGVIVGVGLGDGATQVSIDTIKPDSIFTTVTVKLPHKIGCNRNILFVFTNK
jgi:putative effector of murein hydrolase